MSDNDTDRVSRTDCTPWRDESALFHFYHTKRYSLIETAEALGCSEATVSKWCDRLGVKTRDAQEARDTGTPEELENKQWLRREYIEHKQTCAEIADMLDVTPLTVSRWLRRHGVETRPANAPRTRVIRVCENCGSSFETIQTRDDAKYCSRDCYHDAFEMPTGKDHWSYKENPNKRPAGQEWQNARKEVRKRDGYECRVCGKPESEMDRELDVHHLKRVRDAEDERASVKMDRSLMVAVCRSCHRQVERYAPLLPSGV
jgi:transposase-like protein